MDISNIKIPQLGNKYWTDDEAKLVSDKLTQISSNYKTQIDSVSKLTKVPKELIISFIFIESSGKEKAISSAGAIGLMQLLPSSASDMLVLENNKGRLTEGEKKVLTSYLGNRFTDGILKMKYLGDKKTVNGKTSAVWVTKEDLMKPELNILIGCIYLGLLLDEHTDDKGNIRLDKVVVRYNRGYFNKKGLSGDMATVIKNVPNESKSYIYKLLSTNGTLDLLFN